MLACTEAGNDNKISYDSAINTCEKDQQCSETHCAAGKQDNGSDDLKPAGAKACTPVATHLMQKDVKGALAAQRTREVTHIKPKDMNEALAATNTTEHAEEKKTEESKELFNSFFDYGEVDQGSEASAGTGGPLEARQGQALAERPRGPPVTRRTPASASMLALSRLTL